MGKLPAKLEKKLERRREEDALRNLTDSQYATDFSSNDYLGFARNVSIFKSASREVLKNKIALNGATGSRLLSGNLELYAALEKALCDFHNSKAALVFNSGYDANIGFFSSVPQRSDVIFYDELVHASIRDGIRMGNARGLKFRHNDLVDLQAKLSGLILGEPGMPGGEIYVVTESVFSMDGDSPDLNSFVNFCKVNTLWLIVDEAHAVGVFGPDGSGMLRELGLEHQVFARIVTFGKGMGAHGAAILGDKGMKTYLINFARSFIYTTGLSPHSLATILQGCKHMSTEDGQLARQSLFENIKIFKATLENLNLTSNFVGSESAIHSCIIPGNSRVRKIAAQLQLQGFDVRPIFSPTVAKGRERLRFCLHSYNTEEQIVRVLTLLKSQITKRSIFMEESTDR